MPEATAESVQALTTEVTQLAATQIRMEGKLERIADKLDDKFDHLAAKIDHGDRETLSVVNMLSQEVKYTKDDVKELERKVIALEDTDLKEVKVDIEALKRWRAQVVGAAVGIGAVSGGLTAAIIRGLTGG